MTTVSPNTVFVAERLPNWVKALDRDTLATLGDTLLLEQSVGSDLWFTSASDTQRQTLLTRQARRAACRRTVSALIPSFKTVMAFTEGLLQARIKERFNLELDVHANSLVYVRGSASFAGLMQQYEPVEQSLLLAALHNFTEGQTFDANAGLVAANGYDIENVTPEQLRLAPQNYGDFQLDFIELQPQSNPYPLFRFKPQARLPIKPAEFATLCRELDLGRLYQDYLTATFAPGAVTAALVELRKAEFATLCQVALLKGDIDAAAFVLLERCHDGEALTCADKPMKAVRMSVLGAELHDVVLFVPIDNHSTEPCIAWIPGDSQVPLKRYANSGAFMRDLLGRLDDAAYLTEFLGRINLNMRVPISERLAKRLLDTHPNLAVDTQPCEMPLFDHLQRRHRLWLLSQGQCQAIPTARVDQLDTLDRWEGYLDSGINLLNLAAMFIPVLGPTLMSVMAAQTMNELYHGLADLAEGDKAAGWSHLTGIALNLGLMGAVHGVVWASNNVGAFTDELLQLKGPDGVPRLWDRNIAPYATDRLIDPAWRPNAMGLYEVEGVMYLPRDGRLYPTQVDSVTGARHIVHPSDAQACPLSLDEAGGNGWLHIGDQPAAWDRYQLLRRMEPKAQALDDAHLEQAMLIADVDETTVRKALDQGLPVPWSLVDTLERMTTIQELDRVIAGLRSGQPLTSPYPLPVAALVELPDWPEGLALKVFDGSDAWGPFTEYGDLESFNARRIEVVREDFGKGARIDDIRIKMGEEAVRSLLGETMAETEAQQTRQIEQRLADHLQGKRYDLFEQWHTAQEQGNLGIGSAPLPDAAERVVTGRFPSLNERLARAVLADATTAERALLEKQRLPLRLAEKAHRVQRQRRLNQALLDAAYFPGRTGDSQRVLMAALEHQPGWGADARIELRDGTAAGPLLAASGSAQAGQVRLIGHSQGRFVPYDSNGRPLPETPSLGQALLTVMLPADRTALGYSLQDGGSLERVLAESALTERLRSARALGQAEAPMAFRPPTRLIDGRIGYEASGRGRLGTWGRFLEHDGSVQNRLRALYPNMDEPGLTGIRNRLGRDLYTGLQRLEMEHQVLLRTLDEWVNLASPAQAAARQEAHARIVAAWRQEPATAIPPRIVRPGLGLDLSGLEIGALPTLTARMDHLLWLDLGRMGFTRQSLEGFLLPFNQLTRLYLPGNGLTGLPSQLSAMGRLRVLDLSDNSLAWQAQMFEPLERSNLLSLELSRNPLVLSGEGVLALNRLTSLRRLVMRDAQLALTAADFRVLAQMNLQELDLQDNQIVLNEQAASAFDHMPELRSLNLAGNRLGRAPHLENLRALAYLELSFTGIAEWPDGLQTLLTAQPPALQQVWLLQNPITEVPSLLAARFAGPERPFPFRHLVMDDARLSSASIGRLREIGITPLLANPPIWMETADEELTTRFRALRDEPGAEAFMDILQVVSRTADYRHDPVGMRARLRRVVEGLTPQPPRPGITDLRHELFELAQEAERTCGDGRQLVFNQAENLVEIYRLLTDENGPDLIYFMPALPYSRRLYTLDLVDRFAREIINGRVMRRSHIYLAPANAEEALAPQLAANAQELAPGRQYLHPSDMITDEELQTAPDEVELRLALRWALADRFDLPNAPLDMLYTETLRAPTVNTVAGLVEGLLTSQGMLTWLEGQPYWRSFLRRLYPQAFTELDTRWEEYGAAVFELSRDVPDEVLLPDTLLQDFRSYLPDLPWQPENQPQRVLLNDDDARLLSQVVNQRREEALTALRLELTQPMVEALHLD